MSENDKFLGIKKAKLENLIVGINKTVDKLEDTLKENALLNTKLKPRLIALNFASHAEASKALMTEEEASALFEKISLVKAAIDKSRQSLEDVMIEISKLQTNDDINTGEEELYTQKKELENEISLLDQETGTCNARLALDRENREKTAGLRIVFQNQEKEYARWEALGNLIGDAKGSKFSRFAQQLTLLQMLAKANHHLRKLTDRYILINEDAGENDELFVIDIYHGDERRSVKTLSGGESFLVSLALALGLSDLAGNKTTISSLFIDEGFGSLDQETLDTALSTLERLQTETNRTIGIISHVEALKERITTQIELSKDSMGNSSLTIRN